MTLFITVFKVIKVIGIITMAWGMYCFIRSYLSKYEFTYQNSIITIFIGTITALLATVLDKYQEQLCTWVEVHTQETRAIVIIVLAVQLVHLIFSAFQGMAQKSTEERRQK